MLENTMMAVGPQVRYGDTCVLGDVCADDNAVCREGRCLCRDGFGLNVTGTTVVCGSNFFPAIFCVCF